MNRVLAIALAFALALLGCGGTDGNTDNGGGPDDNVQPPPADTFAATIKAAAAEATGFKLNGQPVAECSGATCDIPVNKAGTYTVDAISPTREYVSVEVVVVNTGDTPNATIDRWGLAPNGVYVDDVLGLEWDLSTSERDLDGDGEVDIVIDGFVAAKATVIETEFYGEMANGGYIAGTMSNDAELVRKVDYNEFKADDDPFSTVLRLP